MKVIQSYNVYDKDKLIQARWDIEFLERIFSLSVDNVRQFYGNATFYWNKEAISFFRNDLWLNYDEYIETENIDSKYRARVKFEVYKQQAEPFIHIDNDVIIKKKYDFENMLFQWIEDLASWNWFYYKPDWIIENYVKIWDKAINTGFFGIKDLDFLQRYTDKAISILDNVASNNATNTLTIAEQMLLYNMLLEENKHVDYILEPIDNPDISYPVITENYIHLLWHDKQQYKHLFF